MYLSLSIGKNLLPGLARLIPLYAADYILKFVRYDVRSRVFRYKRKLKGTGKSITESLKTKIIGQLNHTREKYRFNDVWSYDGIILYK